MRTVLVVCGAGASSTFLALAMRGRAAQRQLALRIEPVAEAQLADRLPQADALLIGVHLAPRFGELQSAAAAVGVPAVLLADGDVGGAGADRAVAAALTALDGSPEVASAPASASLAPHQTQ